MKVTFRPPTGEDEELLVEAVFGNSNWCTPRFARVDLRQRPEFARYTALVSQ